MAIAQRGTGQFGSALNGADVTLTFDVALQENDVVIVFGGHGDGLTTLQAPGSGYTEIFKNEGASPIWGAWYKRMGASPDASVVCNGTPADVTNSVGYCCYAFSGVDAAIFDQTTVVTGPTVGIPNCAAITTLTDGAVVIAMAGDSINDITITGPAGYSDPLNAGVNETNDMSTAGAYFEKATAGVEDPPGFTGWGGSGTYYGITMALKPDASASGGGRLKRPKLSFGMSM